MQCYWSISAWKYLEQYSLALSWAWSRASSHAASEDFGFNFLSRYDLSDSFSLCWAPHHLLRDFNTSSHSVPSNLKFLEYFDLLQQLPIPPRLQQVTQRSGTSCPLTVHRTEGISEGGTLLPSLGTTLPASRCRPLLDSYTHTLPDLLSSLLHPNTESIWFCNCYVLVSVRTPSFCMTSFNIQSADEAERAGRGGSALRTGFISKTVVVKEILSKWLSGSQQQEKHRLA